MHSEVISFQGRIPKSLSSDASGRKPCKQRLLLYYVIFIEQLWDETWRSRHTNRKWWNLACADEERFGLQCLNLKNFVDYICVYHSAELDR